MRQDNKDIRESADKVEGMRHRHRRRLLILSLILLLLAAILSIVITRSACTGNWLDKTFGLSHGCYGAAVSDLNYADNKLSFKDSLGNPQTIDFAALVAQVNALSASGSGAHQPLPIRSMARLSSQQRLTQSLTKPPIPRLTFRLLLAMEVPIQTTRH